MASLGVNIDHIANVRQARRTVEPDPVPMALLAELGGADGITVHLREDRRHIQDRDVDLLRQTVRSRLNLEMAATEDMVLIALRVQPDMVTLVPERREEVTTEGGLDVSSQRVDLTSKRQAGLAGGCGSARFYPLRGGRGHRSRESGFRFRGGCPAWQLIRALRSRIDPDLLSGRDDKNHQGFCINRDLPVR